MVKKEDIIEVLKLVDDPELNVDVWSLGLIYEINLNKNKIEIIMTFTTPMCPYGPMLLEMIEDAIKEKHKDVKEVKIDVTFDPPWEPSEELKAMFGV
ncbi:MAG: metal-sulfur cluster assembly factor [Nanoarchaeota archaeon]